MMEDKYLQAPQTLKLPDLTTDDVVAIVLAPTMFSVLAFSLSLSRDILFFVLFAWQTAAVGFLSAYFWAPRAPWALRFG